MQLIYVCQDRNWSMVYTTLLLSFSKSHYSVFCTLYYITVLSGAPRFCLSFMLFPTFPFASFIKIHFKRYPKKVYLSCEILKMYSFKLFNFLPADSPVLRPHFFIFRVLGPQTDAVLYMNHPLFRGHNRILNVLQIRGSGI